MTCYMIKLRYDGTNYAGYQKQANANTVGEEVLNALTTLFGAVFTQTAIARRFTLKKILNRRKSFAA